MSRSKLRMCETEMSDDISSSERVGERLSPLRLYEAPFAEMRPAHKVQRLLVSLLLNWPA